MKTKKINRAALYIICFAALLLSACGAGVPEPVEEPSPEPSAELSEAPAVETPEPSLEPSPEPKPELPDIDINSWELMLCNSHNSLASYESPLVGVVDGQGIDARITSNVQELRDAARQAGFDVHVGAGNRSFDYLLGQYAKRVTEYGSAEAAAAVFQPPGVNEHQTGLAFDMTDKIEYTAFYLQFQMDTLEDDECYAWLEEHCAEYGFILRYPEGKEEYYGTPCCRSHLRYVGLEAASYIMENGLCLEEFIMLYDEQAVYMPNK